MTREEELLLALSTPELIGTLGRDGFAWPNQSCNGKSYLYCIWCFTHSPYYTPEDNKSYLGACVYLNDAENHDERCRWRYSRELLKDRGLL